MNDVQQIQADLQFVREAVGRRQTLAREMAAINYIWAAYVLVGYCLLDFYPKAANAFFFGGLVVCMIASFAFGRHLASLRQETDRRRGRQAKLHWIGGIVLCVISAIVLVNTNPSLRNGVLLSQFTTILVGLLYFTWGVHKDPAFLWLGPVVVALGLCLPLFAHAWSLVGVIFAAGLVVAAITTRKSAAKEAANLPEGDAHESSH